MKVVHQLPSSLSKGQMVAMDVETFGQEEGKIHRPTGTFACLSICMDNETVYQIYDSAQIKEALRAVSKGLWVFHNAMYDLRQLRRFATIAPRPIWDTMLAERSMTGGLYQTYSLADLYRRWLSKSVSKDVRKEFGERTTMTNEMKEYAARDALITLQIATMQRSAWDGNPGLNAYLGIDEPMLFPILDMPGMGVDADMWRRMTDEFAKNAKDAETELGINSMSQPQVLSALKSRGIHLKDTQKETLKEYSDDPYVAMIRTARLYRKATSTYGARWLANNLESDGKVYPSWNITGAETGRMSCSDPNLQQIPVRELPQYRNAFIPSKGNRMLISDVSQQEPRILAYETKDEELIAALKAGEDLHLTVARTVFNDPKMKHDDPRRKIGKDINLGTSYGLTEYGLSHRLGISEAEARGFLRSYFSRFRSVFSWISMQRRSAMQDGFVKTASGRRVYLNLYNGQWENNAINAPIQGGAADFTKVWVRSIWERCRQDDLEFPVVAIVHDEIVMDVPSKMLNPYRNIMEESFQDAATRLYKGIPFVVDSVIGRSWGAKQTPSEAYDSSEMS